MTTAVALGGLALLNAVVAPAAVGQTATGKQDCAKVRRGPVKDRWRVRNACTVWQTFKGSDSTRREAVRVAWCEGSLDPRATNGPYWGTFQFDEDARRTYGWGNDVASQTAAASDMHDARGWQPWGCRPGGKAERQKWREAPAAVRLYG